VTVVARLLDLVRPRQLWLGEKDWQQLVILRWLVAHLARPVIVQGVATVREADGLALSSRNQYLSLISDAWPRHCPRHCMRPGEMDLIRSQHYGDLFLMQDLRWNTFNVLIPARFNPVAMRQQSHCSQLLFVVGQRV
jgi:hypothetical protein